MPRMLADTLSGIQLHLITPPRPAFVPVEPKGVVYTKRWVVELLLDLAGYTSDENLVDVTAIEPAAGDGAFLEPMVERLVESCLRLDRPLTDCRRSLVAFELNEKSAKHARELCARILCEKGVTAGIASQLTSEWIKTGDYLFESLDLTADLVVGNPPYIRLEDIPAETAELYRTTFPTMRGRADLYIAFYEAALRQLKTGGVCAFICADRWMRNQYGAELRKLVTSAYSVDFVIEMHDADAFHDEVDAYPAITVIRRQKQGAAVVANAGPKTGKYPSRRLSQALLACRTQMPVVMPEDLRTALVEAWFEGSSPWPCQSPEQLALLRRLEGKFPPLEASAKVGIGVATGNDSVFVTKDAGLVEKSRLLKLALAGDALHNRFAWSGHYLVDPWDRDGLVDLKQFPRLGAYFESHASSLKKRHTAINNTNGWYKTIDRVTHALTTKQKLFIPDIKGSLHPVLDNGETYPHHNLYFIQSDTWDLEVLGGLLISAFGQFFVESYGVKMRGGYFRFQAQYLRRIRVPSPESLTVVQASQLREAFQNRDKKLASAVALQVYGVTMVELERALGH